MSDGDLKIIRRLPDPEPEPEPGIYDVTPNGFTKVSRMTQAEFDRQFRHEQNAADRVGRALDKSRTPHE